VGVHGDRTPPRPGRPWGDRLGRGDRVTPATFVAQAVAFVLFRVFDAAKPGPVAWADQRFKRRRGAPIGWAQGFGILFDDVVAALCTLVVIAVWRFV
jgi:phosphatidylglycerophosphatase A